jgi:glucose/arabinose dehydrogenase
MNRVFLIALLILGITYANISPSKDTPNDNIALGQNLSTEEKVYGCEIAGDAIHCDPVPSGWSSFSMKARESKVYKSIRGDLAYATGKYDEALQLYDKNREFIEFENDGFNSSKFSVSLWVKQALETGPYGHILSYVNKNHTAGWYFDSTSVNASNPGSNQTLNFVVTNNASEAIRLAKGIAISPDSFSHIVGTFDGSKGRVYQDGKLLHEFDYNGTYNSNPELPMKIGSAAYCLSCHRWSGTIDEVRYYNRTLTEAEVTDLFRNPPHETLFVDGLAGYWSFDGNIQDISGRGNDGNMFSLISSMAFAPDGRLFFSEKNTGKIRIMIDNKVLPTPFVQIYDHYVNWEQGLLGLTVDPEFEENKFIYLYYTYLDPEKGVPFNKVVRFTEVNNKANQTSTVLIDKIPASEGYHSGGALTFGPDKKLYISVGDATQRIVAQNISLPLGKVLRINTDGTIPEDNPYPNSPVYTLGHRNVYGIAFDNNSDLGIVTENGDTLYDEINLVQKGGNYGYPSLQPVNRLPELANSSSSIKPLRSYFSTIAPTQALFYTGNKFPSLENYFVFGTFTGSIFAIRLDSDTRKLIEEQHIRLNHYPFEAVIGIAQSPTGDIYFGTYNIYKLTSVKEVDKKYDMFHIGLLSSIDVDLSGIQMSDAGGNEWTLILEPNGNKKINDTSSIMTSKDFLNITIPARTAKDISSVKIMQNNDSSKITAVNGSGNGNGTNAMSQNNELDFTLESKQDSLRVNIPLNSTTLLTNMSKIEITIQSPSFSIF